MTEISLTPALTLMSLLDDTLKNTSVGGTLSVITLEGYTYTLEVVAITRNGITETFESDVKKLQNAAARQKQDRGHASLQARTVPEGKARAGRTAEEMKMFNLTGHHYGLLTVLRRAANSPSGEIKWRCECVCKKEIVAVGSDLRRFRIVSCGCDNSLRVRTS